jgi:anti-anti-sigma regulatory factor
MALTFQLSDFGRAFATRERGDELRRLLLEQAAGQDAVVVDFAGVASVSYSFADEFLAKLYADDSLQVEQRNLSPRVAEIAKRAVGRRSDSALSC